MITEARTAHSILVRGTLDGSRASVRYVPGDRVITLSWEGSTVEMPLWIGELRFLLGVLYLGERRITVDEGSKDEARRLVTVASQAALEQAHGRSHTRRVAGVVFAVLALPLLLAACVMFAADDMGRDTCRAVGSWQSERPVEGCEDGSSAAAAVTALTGVVFLGAGLVLIASGVGDD